MATNAESEATNQWLPLYAFAGHMAADFPLQSDGMAEQKFDSSIVRASHVAVHAFAMVPTILASDWSWRQRVTFLAALSAAHYAIDSRRWAEPRDGFETRLIWFDQAYHIVSLAICVAITQRVSTMESDTPTSVTTSWTI